MQAQPLKPHWIPVNPSVLVSAALVLLAALPHQIPPYIRHIIRSPIGGILFSILAAAIFWRKHAVLGMAMLIFVAGIWLDTMSEGFASEILIKDKVKRATRRWEGEEILSEDPHGIQERTDDQILNLDEVGHENAQWFDERVLDVHPIAIQERVSISSPEYDYSQSMNAVSR